MKQKKIDFQRDSIALHKKLQGKIEISLKTKINNKRDLSTVYSPGVAGPCLEIQKNPKMYKSLVSAGTTVAVISDGSAVLGLGNLGALASMPVMEGKAALFKRFANVNAIPIILDTQDTEEIIQAIKHIASSFGGINLEDISAPRCFEIEERLKEELDIPVFHDDQHGTAIVVLAGLINALKVVKKKKEKIKVVINGVGAAGVAITKLLSLYGIKNIFVVDSKGLICDQRKDLNSVKKALISKQAQSQVCGTLLDTLNGADVFIGVSQANLLGEQEIQAMAPDPIVFALANPNPEINPEDAYKFGVKVLATGRSDYDNQINNVLVFPGIFKGVFEKNRKQITDTMKLKAAKTLASLVKEPTTKKIIPGPFEKGIAEAIAKAM
ncbi:NADP-dependent malic enzyme [Candidatus Parcubacteria bacterium]|nr:NADP-dependent malic enzyme [Candidatus Parcubacteria bacterium]